MKAKRNSHENGAVMIVEAAFVFPIVFLVLFILIVAAEANYQRARVERIVVTTVLDAAARCADPTLASIQKSGELETSCDGIKNAPYRYIFTGDINKIADDVQFELEDKTKNLGSFIFKGMEPKNVTITSDVQAGLLASNLKIQCDFDIVLPFRMLLSNQDIKIPFTVYQQQQIMDPAEFVRNVSFVQDNLERVDGYDEAMQKMGNALDKVSQFMN